MIAYHPDARIKRPEEAHTKIGSMDQRCRDIGLDSAAGCCHDDRHDAAAYRSAVKYTNYVKDCRAVRKEHKLAKISAVSAEKDSDYLWVDHCDYGPKTGRFQGYGFAA